MSVRFEVGTHRVCGNSSFLKSTPGTHVAKSAWAIAFVIAANELSASIAHPCDRRIRAIRRADARAKLLRSTIGISSKRGKAVPPGRRREVAVLPIMRTRVRSDFSGDLEAFQESVVAACEAIIGERQCSPDVSEKSRPIRENIPADQRRHPI